MQILSFLTYTFELLPFILCAIFLKKIFSITGGEAFFVYSLIYGTFILLVLFFRYYLENKVISSIFKRLAIVFEFTLICYYYYLVLVNKKLKHLFIFSIIFFVLFAFYDYYTSVERQISFLPLAVECLFFIIIILYFFYEKIQYSLTTPIYLSMSFWISTGFLLYFSGNFFLFLYSRTAIKNELFKIQYNLVYNFFTIIKDILFCIAVIMSRYEATNNSKITFHSDVNEILDSFPTTSNNQANL